MKNLRFVLVAWITLFVYSLSFGQYDPLHYDLGQNTVVAVNGLKLRTKPSLNSKVIDKVPYGEQLEITESSHYGHDTLASDYKVYYSDEEFYQPVLSGYWVKARYDGQEGYVFSGFLYYRFEGEKQYNRKTALLYEGSNCYDNLHYRPDWHWYGLYEVEGVHRLEKVKLDLLVEESDLGPLLTVTTDKEKPSMFIIGSPRPLTERRLFFSEYMGTGLSIWRGGEMDEKTLKAASLEVVKGEEEYQTQLIAVGSTGERQVLNPAEDFFSAPITLEWFGDLDGDGRMDYLVNFGEKSARSVLFLSSRAEAGQLVAPEGAYFSGYCC